MNYSEAFVHSHIKTTIYSGKIQYNPACIYCNNITTQPLLPNDGGCFRRCLGCRKQFQSRVLTTPVPNYNSSLR